MIFKVQVPLYASDGNKNMILVYNHDKSIMTEVAVDNHTLEWLQQTNENTFGIAEKGFYYCIVPEKKGPLEIDGIANWQDW